MKEYNEPFKYWRMKVPMWKRVYWRLPWVARKRNMMLAEKISKEYDRLIEGKDL